MSVFLLLSYIPFFFQGKENSNQDMTISDEEIMEGNNQLKSTLYIIQI